MTTRRLVSIPLFGPNLPGECVGSVVPEGVEIHELPYIDYRDRLSWDPLGAPRRKVLCARCNATVELNGAAMSTGVHRPTFYRMKTFIVGSGSEIVRLPVKARFSFATGETTVIPGITVVNDSDDL